MTEENMVILGSILHMQKGKKPLEQSTEKKEGFLPYVDIKTLEKGISDNYASVENSVLCEKGDLLIVCDGSRSGMTGKAIKGVVCSTLAKIYADGIDNDYLRYFIQSKYILLNTRKKGTGTPHLNLEILKSSKIYLPSLKEQKMAVVKIEEMFSELDKTEEMLQATKTQLEMYRQAVLREAFEGNYPKVQLQDISRVINGYAFKSEQYTPGGKYCVVKIGNVKEGHFDFSRDLTKINEDDPNILNKYLLEKGDCLITLTGSRGKRDYGYVAMIDNENNFLLNQRVAALRFKASRALPEFYQYYLTSSEYRNNFFEYETGNVGQGNVGVKALKEPYVICPSIDEQRRITDRIKEKLSLCDKITSIVNMIFQQVGALRQSILKQIFEGGLQ